MNNLSDFANLGELQIFWGESGGRQTEVSAPGAKDPHYACVDIAIMIGCSFPAPSQTTALSKPSCENLHRLLVSKYTLY